MLPEQPAEQIRPPGRLPPWGEIPPANMTGIATAAGLLAAVAPPPREPSPCPEAAGGHGDGTIEAKSCRADSFHWLN